MTIQQEAVEILKVTGNDAARALQILEGQLNVLYARSQVIMGLAGAIITVTGFSGRLIAGTNTAAQALLISGLGLVVLSAVWMLTRVMGIRWVTSELGAGVQQALETVILRRNRRTQAYQIGGVVLCLGMALYAVSISIMLWNPVPMDLPVR